MKYLFYLLSFSCVFVFACNSAYEKVDTFRDDGTLEASWIAHRETGERHGEYRQYSRDGILVENANYRNNLLHGSRVLFDEEGRKIIAEEYRNDLLHGKYTAWFPEGGIRYSGQYFENAMHGQWIYYYPSGAVKEEVQFEDSETKGPFTEYFEDGTIKTKGNYVPGELEQDILQMFDSTGTLERLMLCNAGLCITQWTPDSGQAKLDEIWQKELQ